MYDEYVLYVAEDWRRKQAMGTISLMIFNELLKFVKGIY